MISWEIVELERVLWFNNRRLLEPIGSIFPVKAGANYYSKSAL